MDKRKTSYFALMVSLLALIVWLSATAALAEQSVAKPTSPTVKHSAQANVPGSGCFLEEDTQNFSSADDGFFGVAAISENDVWAVGTHDDGGYRPLTMHWHGTRWRLVTSPNPQGLEGYLRGVSGVASNDVWAVGYTQDQSLRRNTLILHWDGTVWSTVPSPNGASSNSVLLAVSARSSNDVWAVGYSGTEVLILRWNGVAWSTVNTPPLPAQGVLSGITVLGVNSAWAVGRTYDPGAGENRTLTMRWNGSAWSVVPSPNPGATQNQLNAVSASSESNVWAVGHYRDVSTGDPQTLTLVVRWNGSTWQVVPSPNITNGNYLRNLVTFANNDVWVVGYFVRNANQALAMRWDGTAWSVIPPLHRAATGSSLNAIDGVSGGNVRAVGYTYAGVTSRTLAMRYDAVCNTPTPTPAPPVPTATPTPCATGRFNDVPPDNTFYPFVTCLANRGIISGYGDCTFRPNNEVTRGQLAKIVSNAAGFAEPPDPQIFADVPPGSTFYEFVNRLTRREVMGGYNCGGPGEPCIENRPYFRPGANATRGQTSKIVSNAAGYTEEPVTQTFEDVPPSHLFYREIERLAVRGAMSGYPCGGPGEPCEPGNRAYFRPGAPVTRGQSAKIVANTFYPNCQPR